MMATLDFSKNYEEQSAEAKACICEHDFYEVAKVLGYRIELRKQIKNRG